MAQLQDIDGLVMDNIKLDGKVEKTKWSYNTACLVRAFIARYRVDPYPELKAAAVRPLSAAVAKWIDPKTHLVHNPAPFGQHLLDALFEASGVFHDPSF